MLGGKLVWLTVMLIIVQGCHCSNSTLKVEETNLILNATSSTEKITTETTISKIEMPTTSQNPVLTEKINSTNLNQTNLEIIKIFHKELNITSTTVTEQTNTLNVTSVDSISNTSSTNYTMTGAIASSDVLPFRLPNWAAIAAGVCLVSAVIGYIGCVSYRRFLQRKYGNSQILIGEDVYDTSDLRNFEI